MPGELSDFRAEFRDARKTDREDFRILFKKIDKISDSSTETKVSVGKIEEHLKALNGRVEDLEDTDEETRKRLGLLEYWPWLFLTLSGLIVLTVSVWGFFG